MNENVVMTAEQVARYTGLVARQVEIAILPWKPEYEQELEEINKELHVLREIVDAAYAARGAEKVTKAYCAGCQYHLEHNDCIPDCDYDRQQLKEEVRQAYLNGGRTGYLLDIDGNEYYTTRDGKRHYTRVEG